MQLKNITIFTQLKWNDVPGLIYKSRFIIAVAFAALLLLSSCSKNPITQAQQNILEQYFEENILKRWQQIIKQKNNRRLRKLIHWPTDGNV